MKVSYKVVKSPKGLIMKELKAQVVAIRPTTAGIVAEVKLYCRRASPRKARKSTKPTKSKV